MDRGAQDYATPLEALRDAVALIRAYQQDIRTSAWTGVDLAAKGFCQGDVYRRQSQRLEAALRVWQQEDASGR